MERAIQEAQEEADEQGNVKEQVGTMSTGGSGLDSDSDSDSDSENSGKEKDVSIPISLHITSYIHAIGIFLYDSKKACISAITKVCT